MLVPCPCSLLGDVYRELCRCCTLLDGRDREPSVPIGSIRKMSNH